MFAAMVSRLAVATVTAVGLFVPGVGLSVPLGSGVAAPLSTCLGSVGVAAAQPSTEPAPDVSPSCDDNRKACMSAGAQTGIWGERYVPPEVVSMCMEAYRACVGSEDAVG